METFTTEEQEIEAIKKWWAENGIPIGLGLVIGLGGIFGWRGWQAHTQELAEAASGLYETMITNTRAGEVDKAREIGQQILTEYDSTTYASYASLIMAKLAVDDGDLASAKEQLENASKKAKTKELKLLAQLRLARVILAEGNPDAALSILNKADFSGFASANAELKGDIFVVKGDNDAAVKEYTSALASARRGSEQFSILEMKLDSVGRL